MINKKNPRVLVVDDDRTVLNVIRDILTFEGFSVMTGSSVLEALDMLSDNGAPDLIISDIYMPDMDGWSFCRLLRMQEYREFNNVPILVISGTFQGDEIHRISRENGANDYLMVPFSGSELVDKVRTLIGGRFDSDRRKVLLLDFDSSRQQQLWNAFEEHGFQVFFRTSYDYTVEPSGIPPAIVVLNEQNEGSTTLDTITRIKSHKPETVIIVISKNDNPVPASTYLYSGAAALLKEPITPEELVKRAVSLGGETALLQAGILLKKRNRILSESEERYRFLVENITDAIVQLDAEGRFTYVSPVIGRISGYTPDEILGRPFTDFVHPEDMQALMESYEKTIKGIIDPFEFKALDKYGGVHYVRTSGKPIINDNVYTGIIVVMSDITGERKARDELARERHLFQMLMDTVPEHIYFKDRDSRYIKVNIAKAAYHGLKDPSEMAGRHDSDFFSGNQAKQALADEKQILKTETAMVDSEESETWPDGRVTWMSTTRMPLYDHKGELMGTFGISRDITEKKKAEEFLRESERQMRLILNSQEVGVIIVDEVSHTILFINRKALALFGAPEKEVLGKVCHNFLCQAKRGECPVTDLGQDLDNAERTLSTIEGTEIPILKSVVKIIFQGKNCLMESFVDISELKRAEEEIKTLLSEKVLLLREVHHRIKNNMTTISSLLSLQARSLEDEKAISALRDAMGHIKSMMVIYDKLYRSADFREVSSVQYLNDLIASISSTFPSASKIEIEKKIEDHKLDSKILLPLGIIINELISNSLKYAFPEGKKGKITVSLSALENGSKELVLKDNGVGMPEKPDLKKSRGFGLGLVNMLTDQIEASVDISVHGGTCFRIVF